MAHFSNYSTTFLKAMLQSKDVDSGVKNSIRALLRKRERGEAFHAKDIEQAAQMQALKNFVLECRAVGQLRKAEIMMYKELERWEKVKNFDTLNNLYNMADNKSAFINKLVGAKVFLSYKGSDTTGSLRNIYFSGRLATYVFDISPTTAPDKKIIRAITDDSVRLCLSKEQQAILCAYIKQATVARLKQSYLTLAELNCHISAVLENTGKIMSEVIPADSEETIKEFSVIKVADHVEKLNKRRGKRKKRRE